MLRKIFYSNWFQVIAPWVPILGLALMPMVIIKTGRGYKPWVIVISDIINAILGFSLLGYLMCSLH